MEDAVAKSLPAIAFEHVTVVFPATANQDVRIPTVLRPDDPENIFYRIVDMQLLSAPATAPIVYRDVSTTRKPWTKGTIFLRCNAASVVCVLELTVKRTF